MRNKIIWSKVHSKHWPTRGVSVNLSLLLLLLFVCFCCLFCFALHWFSLVFFVCLFLVFMKAMVVVFWCWKNILTIILDKICEINWPGGVSLTFCELSKLFSRNLWAFQAEAMYVCPPKAYKVSAWNSHHKCDFWHCIFSRDYFG